MPLALIEAKPESRPPGHGLEQARNYARRFNVPFVFSSNGHQYVFYDSTTGKTSDAAPLVDFPKPEQLRLKWQAATKVNLESPGARALLMPYRGGESTRRAVFEKFARGRFEAEIVLPERTKAMAEDLFHHLLATGGPPLRRSRSPARIARGVARGPGGRNQAPPRATDGRLRSL